LERQATLLGIFRDEIVEPGVEDGDVPLRNASILDASLSTQVTTWPKSAKHAPDTSPTYPVPITAMRTIDVLSQRRFGFGNSLLQQRQGAPERR
jgi:hypothetical protein